MFNITKEKFGGFSIAALSDSAKGVFDTSRKKSTKIGCVVTGVLAFLTSKYGSTALLEVFLTEVPSEYDQCSKCLGVDRENGTVDIVTTCSGRDTKKPEQVGRATLSIGSTLTVFVKVKGIPGVGTSKSPEDAVRNLVGTCGRLISPTVKHNYGNSTAEKVASDSTDKPLKGVSSPSEEEKPFFVDFPSAIIHRGLPNRLTISAAGFEIAQKLTPSQFHEITCSMSVKGYVPGDLPLATPLSDFNCREFFGKDNMEVLESESLDGNKEFSPAILGDKCLEWSKSLVPSDEPMRANLVHFSRKLLHCPADADGFIHIPVDDSQKEFIEAMAVKPVDYRLASPEDFEKNGGDSDNNCGSCWNFVGPMNAETKKSKPKVNGSVTFAVKYRDDAEEKLGPLNGQMIFVVYSFSAVGARVASSFKHLVGCNESSALGKSMIARLSECDLQVTGTSNWNAFYGDNANINFLKNPTPSDPEEGDIALRFYLGDVRVQFNFLKFVLENGITVNANILPLALHNSDELKEETHYELVAPPDDKDYSDEELVRMWPPLDVRMKGSLPQEFEVGKVGEVVNLADLFATNPKLTRDEIDDKYYLYAVPGLPEGSNEKTKTILKNFKTKVGRMDVTDEGEKDLHTQHLLGIPGMKHDSLKTAIKFVETDAPWSYDCKVVVYAIPKKVVDTTSFESDTMTKTKKAFQRFNFTVHEPAISSKLPCFTVCSPPEKNPLIQSFTKRLSAPLDDEEFSAKRPKYNHEEEEEEE